MKSKLDEIKLESALLLIECDNCSALVQGIPIGSYTKEEPMDWAQNVLYSLCKCPQCFSPFLIHQELDFKDDGECWDVPQKLFPNNVFHINPVIPDELRRILIEATICYKSKAYTATALMCRRTLEAFCIVKGVKEKNLDKSIKKLQEQGIINEQLFDWANELRLVGNQAAHNVSNKFSAIDSKDILDFTIAILDFTYSFKDKFDKFKKRNRNEK